MARLAVFASGTGSNFVALAKAVATSRHEIELLLCDVPKAPVLARAEELGITTFPVIYGSGQPREATEKKIVRHLERRRVDLVALAGFMRLLTPWFIETFRRPIINLHPSLLPKYPGTHAIEESYRSPDKELGISVIRVDPGVDTGPVLLQKSFAREGTESLAEIEARIHALEHEWFPRVIIGLLDEIAGHDGGTA